MPFGGRRQINGVLEVGYRGALRGGTAFSADLHMTRVEDRMLGTALVIHPVFFNRSSLESYLTNHRDAEEAARVAGALAQVPVGIITPVESPYATDILLVGRQGQSYVLWRLDLTAEVPLSTRASIAGTYSRISYDTISESLPEIPVRLIVPIHKAAVEATLRNPSATSLTSIRVRGVGSLNGGGGLFRNRT